MTTEKENILPCKRCGSADIRIYDCGYSSFNFGGGRCNSCGNSESGQVGCLPEGSGLIAIWNKGQAEKKPPG